MPEGPEIRRAADRLKRVLDGRTALTVRFAAEKFPALQRFSRRLSGRTVRLVEPRGKAMLTHFDNGLTIYSHHQLDGEWAIFKGAAPASHLQTRLAITTATHSAILYSASEIEVLSTDAVGTHPYIAKLGVELLDPDVTPGDVQAQVDNGRFARRNLAALLLDQSFLAGIGNYLRSDILFAAGLHPDVRIAGLAPAQRVALAQTALELTRRSYRTRGITCDPVLAQQLKAQGQRFSQYRHWVFDRAGQPCHLCGYTIRRLEVSGRGLYLCEHCQPSPPRLTQRKQQ